MGSADDGVDVDEEEEVTGGAIPEKEKNGPLEGAFEPGTGPAPKLGDEGWVKEGDGLKMNGEAEAGVVMVDLRRRSVGMRSMTSEGVATMGRCILSVRQMIMLCTCVEL